MKVGGDVPSVLEAIAQGTEARRLEGDRLEFKAVTRSKADALRDIAEAAACLANALGGTIIVGVKDHPGGVAAIVGSDLDPVQVQRRVYELTEPRLTVGVDQVTWRDRTLIEITVPQSPEIHAVGARSTERVGDACEPMSTARIATVVAERRGDDWSAHDSGVPVDGVDAVALGIARSLLARASDPARRAHAAKTDRDLLRALGVVTSRSRLTNAGALLFTDRIEPEQVAYIYRRTPAGELVVNEHLVAPLLPTLTRVLDLITARSDRTSVNLPGGQQVQLADLPEAAVREAVVNAVMHRDYRQLSAIHVEHTATRLRVSSPGAFVAGVTVDNVLTTSSRSRNPMLSAAIRTLDLAETAGTGVDRMYVEMTRVGHAPPVFTADIGQVQVTLVGGAPNTSLARFTATLPGGEANDADTMLVLFALLGRRKITADLMAPTLQKSTAETQAVLARLSAPPVDLLEPTRESVRRARPDYRLREHVVAALGPALSYRRRTADEYDRKIIGIMRETGEVNARMVRLVLDLDASATSRVLSDLVERQILAKTSKAARGPSVTYGAGPLFPRPSRVSA